MVLPYRSQCTCSCHSMGGIHIVACCIPDPGSPEDIEWQILKIQLANESEERLAELKRKKNK